MMSCSMIFVFSFFLSTLSLANLTGHVERVGIENFELLKVLGTGGEENLSLSLCVEQNMTFRRQFS